MLFRLVTPCSKHIGIPCDACWTSKFQKPSLLMDSQSSTDYLHLTTHFISWAFFIHLKQYTTAFMPPKQSRPCVHWNNAETLALIDYLHAHQSEAEGGVSFLTKTYNGALKYIKNLNLHTQGAKKTVQHVKHKTKVVSNKFLSIEMLLIFLNLQLKDQWCKGTLYDTPPKSMIYLQKSTICLQSP